MLRLNYNLKKFFCLKGKRGSVVDIFFVSIVLFAFAFGSLIGFKILDKYNDLVQASDMGEQAKDVASIHQSRFIGTFDAIFGFIFFGVGMALIVSAFMVRSHPVFFFFMMLILVFFIIVWALLANIYDDAASMDAFSDIREEFVMQEYLMHFFPFALFILGLLIAIVQYSKDYLSGTI